MLYYVSFRYCNATCRIGLLVLAVLIPVITTEQICTVSNSGRTLAQCLQDPSASDVVLLHDWTLRPVYNQTAPLRILRNCIITNNQALASPVLLDNVPEGYGDCSTL